MSAKDKYAQLVIRKGVNIQPGQALNISASIECADFVRALVREAYGAGAKFVHVDWSDDELSLIRYLHAPEEAFHEYPRWRVHAYEDMVEAGAAFLTVYAPNPELLKEIDANRLAVDNRTASVAMKQVNSALRSGKNRRSLVSVPTVAWAQHLFPDVSTDDALNRLWDLILQVTRSDQSDPLEAWDVHVRNLEARRDYLNDKRFRRLYYHSRDVNLTMELPDRHLWIGGGIFDPEGIFCLPNIPTEELFTAPVRESVEGMVRSTMPLIYSGHVIDHFTLTFHAGRVVEFSAEKGEDVLEKLLEMDEGSRFLGEVAIVPQDSPIAQLGVVFENTLFDENASCHLALGNAYPICLDGGDGMTASELSAAGLNQSLTHVDFMIGTDDLEIVGEAADGRKTCLLRNGRWAL